jgi:hypothetical protein
MPSDRTRTSDDQLQQYQAVVLQQGRVILDRDFNALQEVLQGRLESETLDAVGPCGTPDNGFAVSTPSVGASASAPLDFFVSPGSMYVGGRRAVLPVAGGPWSYSHQPDWHNPDPAPAFASASFSGPAREYVTLHVFEQEVGAVEDPDLLDVALGGPDTTQRVRLMQRIRRMTVNATDPVKALAEAGAAWLKDGFRFDAATMRLAPQASLQVSFPATSSGPPNPCENAAPGGYLGAENQLIRVQLALPVNNQPQLLWGYDNASFLYRVRANPDGQTLQLSQSPVDAFHAPKPQQIVEVLRTAVVLGAEPDETDPTGVRTIVRCVATASGFIATVQTFSPSDDTVVLAPALPPAYTTDSNPLFLRVWQGRQPFDPASSQPVLLTDPTGQPSPGLLVTITTPRTVVSVRPLILAPATPIRSFPPAPPPVLGRPIAAPIPPVTVTFGAPPVGAFWMIAVRPGTPQAVYPERFLTGPQPPDGPRQWVCPLAVIDWAGPPSFSAPAHSAPAHSAPSGPVIYDCRQQFASLATLTNRGRGCCTLTVLPSDADQLQDLIDNAVAAGGPVAVCFAPGVYNLLQPLVLTSQHNRLILEGCPGGATLRADSEADPTLFLDGLIVIVAAGDVTLRKFQFNLPGVPPATGSTTPVQGQPNMLSMIGVQLLQSTGVKIEACFFSYSPPTTAAAFAAGILARGDCRRLTVHGCRFESTAPATATPPPAPAVGPVLLGLPFPIDVGLPRPITGPPHEPPPHPPPEPQPATPLPPPLSLFGFLAAATSVQIGAATQPFPPILHESVFCDNDFVNLTLPVLAVADAGTLRLDRNRVRGCLGGFWLEASDAVDPLDLPSATGATWRSCYAGARGFTEVGNAFSIGPSFPWPAGLDLSILQGPPASTAAAIAIVGNRIDTVLSSSAAGGPGLTLALNRPLGPDSAAAVVVAANELRGNSTGASVPTVLLSVPGAGATGAAALTGNLFVNIGGSAPPFPSLLIFPGAGGQNVVGLAVTGNVLVGPTNLGDLNLPPPLTTWLPLNSIYPPPQPPAPIVAGLSPNAGTANTVVVIAGSGFIGATQVTFGGVAAVSFRINSDRLVTAVAPALPAGAPPAEVLVWTPNGTSAPLAVGLDIFKYTAAPPPAVTGVSPTTGGVAGGYKVAVSGSGFTGATAVKFAGLAATFTINSDASITATAPAATAPGPVDVNVTTPSGLSPPAPGDRFLYIGPPVVTAVSPSQAIGAAGSTAGGFQVTITGSGFLGATAVTFGGAAVPFTVNSDASITATAPVRQLPVGTVVVDIVVTTPSGQSQQVGADQFRYIGFVRLPPPPPPRPGVWPPRPGIPRILPQ